MKRTLLTAAILTVLAVMGCNPFGTDATKVWVTGIIYTDSTFSLPAEGIAVLVTGAAETYLDATDAGGVFSIEVQFYEESQGGGGGGHKGTDGSTMTFGVKAVDGDREYVYGGTGGTFTITMGDTLTMYPVDLTMFTERTETGTGGH